ncbi:YqxA family protein [Bacillus velezensis]|uniref:YqxA family protein n=1 Tax=Bacillus amyloliquefaciens group TaxID=1938374 RepID=UPI001CC982DF|nr:YqxA family protein [Bacillus velezensis]MEC2149849.1 YqxA family protein [Bacillus velezensis]MEC2155947.1 YqxA family protein [Bacillus velezensis]UBQ45200.1 YqxA family protein [Bacillus velezensis]WGS36790.1 YqxA family protein [Bacillus velezensis]
MIRFTGKCLLIAIVMFFGVLFGMQQANSGMLDMKGYKDPSLKGAFTLGGGGEGQEKEASILGQTVTAKDLEEKQKQLEQAETFNLFSKAGETLSNTVTDSAQAMYEWVSKLNR